MTPDGIRDSLIAGLPALFDCRAGLRADVQVITPLQYPDGGFVDVFVVEDDGEYIVTDYGDAQAWLQMQSFHADLTPDQQELITRTCRGLGVSLDHGCMALRCADASQLAGTILRLALAIVRVADVRHTFGISDDAEGAATLSNGARRLTQRHPRSASRHRRRPIVHSIVCEQQSLHFRKIGGGLRGAVVT